MSTGEDRSLVEHTRRVWQPRARRELTEDDCREIQRNVLGFVTVLRDWAQSERDQAAADSSKQYLTLANTTNIHSTQSVEDQQ